MDSKVFIPEWVPSAYQETPGGDKKTAVKLPFAKTTLHTNKSIYTRRGLKRK